MYHYLRHNPVWRHDKLNFFRPWVCETKPLTLEGNIGAVFRFELVALRLNLLFASKNCQEIGHKLVNYFERLHDNTFSNFSNRIRCTALLHHLACVSLRGDAGRPGGSTRNTTCRELPAADNRWLWWLWDRERTQGDISTLTFHISQDCDASKTVRVKMGSE